MDIKKLNQAREKLNILVDYYMEKDTGLIEISEDNIYMKFAIGNQDYVAFSLDSDNDIEIDMTFARVEIIDDKNVLKNIAEEDELEEVISVFNKILSFIED